VGSFVELPPAKLGKALARKSRSARGRARLERGMAKVEAVEGCAGAAVGGVAALALRSFCDTAAWLYSGLGANEEFTLPARGAVPREWFKRNLPASVSIYKVAVKSSASALLLVIAAVCGLSAAALSARARQAHQAESERNSRLTSRSRIPLGRTVKLSDYRGKVVLLNFGPPGADLQNRDPVLWNSRKLTKKKDRKFAVLGVSMDDDGWESVRPYIDGSENQTTASWSDPKSCRNLWRVDRCPPLSCSIATGASPPCTSAWSARHL